MYYIVMKRYVGEGWWIYVIIVLLICYIYFDKKLLYKFYLCSDLQ